MLGYLSYLAGELAGAVSGIVTLFCCAVAISHYALHNISAPARVTLVRSCQTLSYVSEGAIFIYVGMDTLDPLKWKVGALHCIHGSAPLCMALPLQYIVVPSQAAAEFLPEQNRAILHWDEAHGLPVMLCGFNQLRNCHAYGILASDQLHDVTGVMQQILLPVLWLLDREPVHAAEHVLRRDGVALPACCCC